MSDLYYKVTGVNGEAIHGGTGTWNLPTRPSRPAKWMPKIENVQLCVRGYHIVKGETNLIQYLGPRVWVVEWDGMIVGDSNKFAVSRARIVRKTNWNEDVAVEFAIKCAEHVLHLFEDKYPNNDRPRIAIEVAKNRNASAARAAASDAASAASAASDAASAARAAAYAARAAAYAASDAADDASAAAAYAAYASAAASDASYAAARAARAAASYASDASYASSSYALADERQYQEDVLYDLLHTGN